MELDFDNWNGNINKGETILLSKDSIGIILEKLNNLNQKQYTQVIIGTEDNYLLIGGGKGQYICTFTKREDEEYFNVVNQTEKNYEEEISIVTGGQLGLFSKRIILDYETTLSALKYYFYNVEMNPSLDWEQD